MHSDDQIRLVAATAVASAIASGTAHLLAQEGRPNSTGVRAAQMAAQVAGSVAAGDAEKTASLIRETAKLVDEAVSGSSVSVTVAEVDDGDSLKPPERTRSMLCSIL